MPYKYYYGKTGRVWNVTKRALGIEMLKTVGNRKRTKRFHVRVEHLRHSKCRKKFLDRVRSNDKQKAEYKQAKEGEGNYVSLKRQPEGPKCGYVLKKRLAQKCFLCGRFLLFLQLNTILSEMVLPGPFFSWVKRIFSHWILQAGS